MAQLRCASGRRWRQEATCKGGSPRGYGALTSSPRLTSQHLHILPLIDQDVTESKHILPKHPEKKPISKFFPKKIVDEKQPKFDVQKRHFPESAKEEADVEAVKGHDTETASVKKELDETKDRGFPTASEDGEKDDKPSVPHGTKGTDISGAKREYEQVNSASATDSEERKLYVAKSRAYSKSLLTWVYQTEDTYSWRSTT
ncbi:hypothetical protein Taro_009911 [Colocasia esculenta]|uniref:Uncharacterized protein n=1 Tax=Colocasia esculenta TaxID=4460 RepID=A0A843UBE1_COLES|nr:hypothetical protein [Colocasia esculenta]